MIVFPAEATWASLDPSRLFAEPWTEFRHRQLGTFLHELARSASAPVQLRAVGSSDEGRALWTLAFGNPAGRRVLVWARQHGNEPDCQAGLALALDAILHRSGDPVAEFLLERLSFLVFPMVNPDGVARFTRENAQGIDLNRDAVALSTPEARALYALKESFDPEFCFNLHDMSPRKSRADGHLVSLAFQAGPFEEGDTDNATRLKAKQVVVRMAEACRPWAPENLARYRADYMHRAFGDSMMRWGVSSILIEAGGWFDDKGGDDFVRRLFALAFLKGLHAVAAGEDAPPDPAAYEAIPLDSDGRWADLLVRNGYVQAGSGHPHFRADLHIDRIDTAEPPKRFVRPVGRIVSIGDLEDTRGKETVDASELLLTPGLVLFAPWLRLDGREGAEAAMQLLRAGITTVAVGAGPFPTEEARYEWRNEAAALDVSPNVVAFELVEDLDLVRARHGLTDLAGYLVRGLTIDRASLLRLIQLFHPAGMLPPDSAIEDRVGLDLFYIPSPSPSSAQVRIHLSRRSEATPRRPIDERAVRQFCSDFLRHPGQVSLCCDGRDGVFTDLPVLVDVCGLEPGPVPPDFLGQVLRATKGSHPSALAATITMLTRRPAGSLQLAQRGVVEREAVADLAGFPRVDGAQWSESAYIGVAPRLVVLNGTVAVDATRGIGRAVPGKRLLAAEPRR
ncbi:MAG: M14 family zinc carboxypeptidase [Candidatus Sumerlaeia bacterium]|nr:M14 family zinc carboxypeptidase [Candidatus Sumerlaeia bacterium]